MTPGRASITKANPNRRTAAIPLNALSRGGRAPECLPPRTCAPSGAPAASVAWNAAIAANKPVATSAATTVNSTMASDLGSAR
jgi:hypothetical protein